MKFLHRNALATRRKHAMARGSFAPAATVLASAAVALLIGAVGVAQASAPPTAAEGTFTQTATTGFDLRLAGPNVIVEQTTVGSVSGTLTGSFEDSLKVVLHPTGRFSAQGTLTCECMVDGKTGVVEFVSANTGEELNGIPTFEGRFVITGATGELSGLVGVLEFEGEVDLASGLSMISYSGEIHFHP